MFRHSDGMTSPEPLRFPDDWHGGSTLHRYLVCDVFAEEPLAGNQVAVFLDGRPLSGEEMQHLARELALSETVFLLPPEKGGDVAMRIFTPATELPFAGHPTLGTAFVVATALDADAVTLETGAGPVPVALTRDRGRVVFGWMRQPLPTFGPYEQEGELLAALGVERSLLPVDRYQNGPTHVYVALPDEESVAAVRPDVGRLDDLGIGANCFAGAGDRWKTRMFYPSAGVGEDPATGSAAGPLALHLARHGRIGWGEEIRIRQGVEIGRPSLLHARVEGEGDRVDLIEVGGRAHIVAEGRYRLTAD
jgi:trans-2,3-dihydro-3-hydroxyanthranilate isomerase